MYRRLLIVFLVSYSYVSHAQEFITMTNGERVRVINDDNAITTASAMSTSLNNLSAKMTACVKREGKSEECACRNRATCPFKEELDALIEAVCKSIEAYPEWGANSVYYALGHTLNTKFLYRHYGAYCD